MNVARTTRSNSCDMVWTRLDRLESAKLPKVLSAEDPAVKKWTEGEVASHANGAVTLELSRLVAVSIKSWSNCAKTWPIVFASFCQLGPTFPVPKVRNRWQKLTGQLLPIWLFLIGSANFRQS